MKIYKKLEESREKIQKANLKKTGRNTFSKYDYYTPEQVESLVAKACKETKTIVICNLKADEFGLYQTLDFIDLESDEKLSFEMRTKHGSIKATNETQQMGGTDTYSERYIKMKVFQIKDNNLDFDSQDNRVADKPVEDTDITVAEFSLKACGDLDELQVEWQKLSVKEQTHPLIVKLKNNLKTKLK